MSNKYISVFFFKYMVWDGNSMSLSCLGFRAKNSFFKCAANSFSGIESNTVKYISNQNC
jgi:hypothetical protein